MRPCLNFRDAEKRIGATDNDGWIMASAGPATCRKFRRQWIAGFLICG